VLTATLPISPQSIFEIDSSEQFNATALKIFHYQAKNNLVYNAFIQHLGIDSDTVSTIEEIPFLPINFFKTQKVITGNAEYETTFLSSATIGSIQSNHYVKKVELYTSSFQKGFEQFYGKPEDLCILALLPSYLEREGSSLIYMADALIKQSKHPKSGFYLNNYAELIEVLQELETAKQPTLLLGVSFALLDVAEQRSLQLSTTTIMETGGMKGKRKEMIREELHSTLCNGFGVSKIHSEYGMTELLSQAYSAGDGIFNCPNWMKVMARDTNDPMRLIGHNKTGGLNVIDLANLHSCSFIATQDLCKTHENGSFEVLGRFDNSDIRGCNLMVG
jgi:hypothetical protein